MKRLSYILPVYNVEQYIAQCLDSIYNQGMQDNAFEVICVDDCSTDNSIDIIREYQRHHDNIIVIAHTVNKKAGGARNSGLKAARGEYVWFVDSDDTICSNVTPKLLKRIYDENLDVLSFNMYIQNGDELKKDTTFSSNVPASDGMAFLHNIFGKGLIYHLGYPVRSIYRRSVLLDNAICFPEGMLYGEETTFMAEAICALKRVGCIADYVYCYRQNTNSSSVQLFEGMRGELIFESCIIAGDMVVRLYDILSSKSQEIADELRSGIPWFVNRMFIRLVKTTQSERRNFYLALRKSSNTLHPAFAYMDIKNRLVVKYPKCGMVWLNILSAMYRIKHKRCTK